PLSGCAAREQGLCGVLRHRGVGVLEGAACGRRSASASVRTGAWSPRVPRFVTGFGLVMPSGARMVPLYVFVCFVVLLIGRLRAQASNCVISIPLHYCYKSFVLLGRTVPFPVLATFDGTHCIVVPFLHCFPFGLQRGPRSDPRVSGSPRRFAAATSVHGCLLVHSDAEH
ncbi:hypothetical protein PanWU01x14_037820, partial [Parasponia andersonii]